MRLFGGYACAVDIVVTQDMHLGRHPKHARTRRGNEGAEGAPREANGGGSALGRHGGAVGARAHVNAPGRRAERRRRLTGEKDAARLTP